MANYFTKPKQRFMDGYTENPFAHDKFTTNVERENEYFMQWVHPLKLHRIALRTPAGYRITYIYSKDLWNNQLGIDIENEPDASLELTRAMTRHLKNIGWYEQMEKISGYEREQGESILMLYYDDEGGVEKYKTAISPKKQILKVEAINKINYHIPSFNKFGQPEWYNVLVPDKGGFTGEISIQVHPSRLKAAGEAAFRWGTGHPVIFTKDIFNDSDLQKLQSAIGDPTRRSWHMLPSEFVERIDLLGQAGSMLNLKALADICYDQIVMGTSIPRPILLGEVAGVVEGSEVNERVYFAKLDVDQTDLEPFCRDFFQRDNFLRRLLKPHKYWEIDWGIREVFNKMDAVEYEQKKLSNALAMLQFATINEGRKAFGLEDIGDDAGGDIIPGLMDFYLAEAMAMEQEAVSTDRQSQSTSNPTEIEKNKISANPKKNSNTNPKRAVSDAISNWMKMESINEISRQLEIYPKTLKKLLDTDENQ